MRKTLLFICLIYCRLAAAQADVEIRNFISTIVEPERRNHASMHSLGNLTEGLTFASNNFDIKYYRCEWEVDPAVRFIKGAVTSYFMMTADGSSVTYDLTNTLIVDSVKRGNTRLTFTQDASTVTVNFTASLPIGRVDSVTIYYKGVPGNTGFDSFVNQTQNGTPIVWTLSEPYGSRDWWPCKNNVNDKADSLDVVIKTPAQYLSASNGKRTANYLINGGTTRVTEWKHRYPITSYLVCMAATNYQETNASLTIAADNSVIPYNIYSYASGTAEFTTKRIFLEMAMNEFVKRFGPYPFKNEGYAATQFGWSGGIEHQTNSFVQTGNDDQLAAHELAHQWFGDFVTCNSFKDIWLNEGFATHLNTIYREAIFGTVATRIARRAAESNFVTSATTGSLRVPDTTDVNRIFDSRTTYFKGSRVIFMLRFIMGDDVFFKAVRNYLNDPAIKYGYANTAQFKNHLERESGKDLTEFFKDWYEGEGYPTYNVQWNMLGNNRVKIKMNQTQSNPVVNFFELPVKLVFKNATQSDTMIVDNKFNGEVFLKRINFVPDTVLIDPEWWLTTRGNTSQKLQAQVFPPNSIRAYPNPMGQQLNLEINNVVEPSLNAIIYNSIGQRIWSKTMALANGEAYEQVNTSQLPAGHYVLHIYGGNVNLTKQFIK